jgi:putative endopeptidase
MHTRLFSISRFIFCAFVSLSSLADCRGAETTLKSGIDRSNFDTSVKPGDGFYNYVNGKWIERNPIPPEYSRWGAFPKLRDDNLLALREILEDLDKQSTPLDAERRKLRDFYKAAMDEANIEKLGATPLKEPLAKIAVVDDSTKSLATEAGRLREIGVAALFNMYVDQDEKQSTRYTVILGQGGMGLPDRDYYVGKTDDSKRIREQYQAHVAKMLMLIGDSPDDAAKGAETVLRIETQMAEKSRTPVELRDREANYNRKSMPELAELTPNLSWDSYLDAVDIHKVDHVVVGQPEFFERVNQLVKSIPLADWRTYLRWHLVHGMAPFLSSEFENENFRFYSQELRGVKEMQPRWKRVITVIDDQMGEALGKLYVERHFPPAAKKRMDELVKNLMAAYRERIETRDWMGEKTKKLALAKLETVMPKIGYPSKWRDYSALEIVSDSYAANAMNAEAFETAYRLSRLDKPVDRLEWHMTPPTVNAYYNASLNEIVFPAGILQPPFFDMTADDAVNYGGIGAVIGHEISHGFDDQGSRSDAQGNLKNWWDDKDRERFTAKTDRLVKQYNECVVLNDLHVNGQLTLGENIADLGGVMIAYSAYQKSLHGAESRAIDGFTGPQRFFVGFAQVWRGSIRDAELRLRIRTDPHSPAEFRTLIPLSNVDAFYEAFDVKPGDSRYRAPADRVEVW